MFALRLGEEICQSIAGHSRVIHGRSSKVMVICMDKGTGDFVEPTEACILLHAGHCLGGNGGKVGTGGRAGGWAGL